MLKTAWFRCECGRRESRLLIDYAGTEGKRPELLRCRCGRYARCEEEWAPPAAKEIILHKDCKRCGIVKPIYEYYPDRYGKRADGHRHICKECDKEVARENWRKAHSLRIRRLIMIDLTPTV